MLYLEIAVLLFATGIILLLYARVQSRLLRSSEDCRNSEHLSLKNYVHEEQMVLNPPALQEDIPMTQPRLRDSKLYAFARLHPLLKDFEPTLDIQMSAEEYITINEPRPSSAGEGMRMLVNYTNQRQNNTLYTFVDNDRLDGVFDIDHFLAGLLVASEIDKMEDADDVAKMNMVLMVALQEAVAVTIGLVEEKKSFEQIAFARQVLAAILTVVFNDPLDVVVFFRDAINEQTGQDIPLISHLWVVKKRQPLSVN